MPITGQYYNKSFFPATIHTCMKSRLWELGNSGSRIRAEHKAVLRWNQTERGSASLLGLVQARQVGLASTTRRAMTDQTARGSAIHAQSSPSHAPSDSTFKSYE